MPLATYTGWNLFRAGAGPTDVLSSMQGSYVPFPLTAEDRERMGDSRRSIEERYGSRAAYLGRVTEAALALVDQGYLLAGDLAPILSQSARHWDYPDGGGHRRRAAVSRVNRSGASLGGRDPGVSGGREPACPSGREPMSPGDGEPAANLRGSRAGSRDTAPLSSARGRLLRRRARRLLPAPARRVEPAAQLVSGVDPRTRVRDVARPVPHVGVEPPPVIVRVLPRSTPPTARARPRRRSAGARGRSAARGRPRGRG